MKTVPHSRATESLQDAPAALKTARDPEDRRLLLRAAHRPVAMNRWSIEMAPTLGLTLCKWADPIEGSREGLTIEEAINIARVDPSLVYATPDNAAIASLRVAAGQAGDFEQVALCNLSLSGDEQARAICGEVILDAAGR